MARVNKRQHYVPQFLLRRFSPPDKPTIRLLVTASGKSVDSAPIKGQCYKNDFYGEDPFLDRGLQEIEAWAAPHFRCLETSDRSPAVGTDEHAKCITFLLAQLGRTPAAADQTNALADKFHRETSVRERLRRAGLPAKYADNIKFRFNEPSLASVLSAFTALPLVVDLRVSLLVAPDSAPFILGDDPVVEINQAYGPGNRTSHTGRAMRGYQALCPISPKRSLMYFDSHLYKVGKPDHFQTPVTAADVEIFNGLQVANSGSVLYAGPNTTTTELKRLFSKFGNYRRGDRSAVDRLPVPPKNGRQRELVYAHTVDLKNPLPFSFCRVKRAFRGAGHLPYDVRDREVSARSVALDRDDATTPNQRDALLIFAIRRAMRSA